MINTLKWPLIVSLVVIGARILLEEMGAPGAINNILGVAWLSFLIPIYLAVRLAGSGEEHPYRVLLKLIALYAVSVRLMVLVTYSMAYLFSWSAPRFSVQGGGVVGEGVTALQGLLVTPATNFPIGVLMSAVFVLVVGPAALALSRYLTRAKAAD